jgi:hypothetical protein
MQGVVDGILTFVGVAGLLSKNQFVERVFLLLTPASELPQDEVYTSVRALPCALCLPRACAFAGGFAGVLCGLVALCAGVQTVPWRMHFYTVIQLACLTCCW